MRQVFKIEKKLPNTRVKEIPPFPKMQPEWKTPGLSIVANVGL